MSINTLYQGDCLEVMQAIEGASVDMILCDLPYGITACKWDTVIPFEPLWAQYKRIIKPHGAIVLTANQPFTSALVMSQPKMFRHVWVWDKHFPRGLQTARFKPMVKHEDVLVFSSERLDYYPIKTPLAKPRYCKNYGQSKSSNVTNDINKTFRYVDKNPVTIITGLWEANAGKIHPTQKPVALFEYLIKTYTKPGELVLDNCAGSGTTGIAARNTGRNFILIEQDAGYCEAIVKRMRLVRKDLHTQAWTIANDLEATAAHNERADTLQLALI